MSAVIPLLNTHCTHTYIHAHGIEIIEGKLYVAAERDSFYMKVIYCRLILSLRSLCRHYVRVYSNVSRLVLIKTTLSLPKTCFSQIFAPLGIAVL